MKQTELNEILRKHEIWLNYGEEGERADFRGIDLRGANLSGASFEFAYCHTVFRGDYET